MLGILLKTVALVVLIDAKFPFQGHGSGFNLSPLQNLHLTAHHFHDNNRKYSPGLLYLLKHGVHWNNHHTSSQLTNMYPPSSTTEQVILSQNSHENVGQNQEHIDSTQRSDFNVWKSAWLKTHFGTCGKQRFQPKNPNIRIIGGTASRKGSWPWMVSLYFLPFKQAICAGILIDRSWMITAAHCLDLPFLPLSMDIKQHLVVRVGVHNASNFIQSETEQRTRIQYYYRPSGYHSTSPFAFDNDIVLIKLEEPIHYTMYVQPICLPTEDERVGNSCVITGWGRKKRPNDSESDVIDQSAWPGTLQQATVPIISHDECGHKEGYENKVTNNMICAGYSSGQTDSCTGDSGGPLQCVRDGQWHISGITSWGGQHYTECAEPDQPGVYTRVNNYFLWILNVLYKDSN